MNKVDAVVQDEGPMYVKWMDKVLEYVRRTGLECVRK